MRRVEFKKSIFGRRSVSYDCPQCQARLTSALKEAGNRDSCPDCGAPFAVPGVEERARVQHEYDAGQKQKADAKEAARRNAEATRQAAEAERVRQLSLQTAPPSPPRNYDDSPPESGDLVRCPHCGSSQVSANKKGFGAGKAAAGCLLIGPIGLLGGAIGGNKVVITCLKCGGTFEPGQG